MFDPKILAELLEDEDISSQEIKQRIAKGPSKKVAKKTSDQGGGEQEIPEEEEMENREWAPKPDPDEEKETIRRVAVSTGHGVTSKPEGLVLVERKGALKTNPLTLAPRIREDRNVSFGSNSIHEIEAENEGKKGRYTKKERKTKRRESEDSTHASFKFLRWSEPYHSPSGDSRFPW